MTTPTTPIDGSGQGSNIQGFPAGVAKGRLAAREVQRQADALGVDITKGQIAAFVGAVANGIDSSSSRSLGGRSIAVIQGKGQPKSL